MLTFYSLGGGWGVLGGGGAGLFVGTIDLLIMFFHGYRSPRFKDELPFITGSKGQQQFILAAALYGGTARTFGKLGRRLSVLLIK